MRPWTIPGLAVCLFLLGCDGSQDRPSDPSTPKPDTRLVGPDGSKKSPSGPNTSKPDNRLIGEWRCSDGIGDVTYYHIGPAGEKFPGGVLRVVETRHSQGKVEPAEEYLALPTDLGGETHLIAFADGDGRLAKLLEENERLAKLRDELGLKADVPESYAILEYGLSRLRDRSDRKVLVKASADGNKERGTVVELIDRRSRLRFPEEVERAMIGEGLRPRAVGERLIPSDQPENISPPPRKRPNSPPNDSDGRTLGPMGKRAERSAIRYGSRKAALQGAPTPSTMNAGRPSAVVHEHRPNGEDVRRQVGGCYGSQRTG